jgi:hypothetical protein
VGQGSGSKLVIVQSILSTTGVNSKLAHSSFDEKITGDRENLASSVAYFHMSVNARAIPLGQSENAEATIGLRPVARQRSETQPILL